MKFGKLFKAVGKISKISSFLDGIEIALGLIDLLKSVKGVDKEQKILLSVVNRLLPLDIDQRKQLISKFNDDVITFAGFTLLYHEDILTLSNEKFSVSYNFKNSVVTKKKRNKRK